MTRKTTYGATALIDMAVERGETYESLGAGKASAADLAIYVAEIADELRQEGYRVAPEAEKEALESMAYYEARGEWGDGETTRGGKT